MPDKPKSQVLSDEELTTFEVSEDRRLREMGIDPDGDPIDIMVEVSRRYKLQQQKNAERRKQAEAAS